MVQISNSLIIAAAVVPALAAPVLEAREPFGFHRMRKAGRISGQFGGANMGPKPDMLQQRDFGADYLETREPKITKAEAKVIAKSAGKVAQKVGHYADHGIEFGAAVDTLVPTIQNAVHHRELETDELVAREPRIMNGQGEVIAKGPSKIALNPEHRIAFDLGPAVVGNLIPVQTHRLVAREPRITKAQAKAFAKGAGKVAHHLGHGVEFGAAAGTLASTVTSAVQQRELDDIEARGFFHSLKHDLKGATHDILKADATGLTVASKGLKFVPGVGKGVATAAGVAAKGVNAVANNVNARDFLEEEDIMAREPRISRAEAKAFAKAAGKVAHHVESGVEVGSVASAFLPQKQQNQQRSLEYLDARGRFPKFHFPGSHMRDGGRAAAGFAGPAAPSANTQPQQRDFDDSELEAREPRFRFGSLLHKAEGVAGKFIRDDELEAREPKFGLGSIFRKAEGLAGKFIRETPEIDELD